MRRVEDIDNIAGSVRKLKNMWNAKVRPVIIIVDTVGNWQNIQDKNGLFRNSDDVIASILRKMLAISRDFLLLTIQR